MGSPAGMDADRWSVGGCGRRGDVLHNNCPAAVKAGTAGSDRTRRRRADPDILARAAVGGVPSHPSAEGNIRRPSAGVFDAVAAAGDPAGSRGLRTVDAGSRGLRVDAAAPVGDDGRRGLREAAPPPLPLPPLRLGAAVAAVAAAESTGLAPAFGPPAKENTVRCVTMGDDNASSLAPILMVLPGDSGAVGDAVDSPCTPTHTHKDTDADTHIPTYTHIHTHPSIHTHTHTCTCTDVHKEREEKCEQ